MVLCHVSHFVEYVLCASTHAWMNLEDLKIELGGNCINRSRFPTARWAAKQYCVSDCSIGLVAFIVRRSEEIFQIVCLLASAFLPARHVTLTTALECVCPRFDLVNPEVV